MSTTPRGDGDPEVVKWYTRARRFPQLIGKTPSGGTIWGGPYTVTQVIAFVVLVVVGAKTTWLWGHFGPIGNPLILLGAAYGLVLVLGRVPPGSRNPLSVAAGTLRALGAPRHGRMAGRPVHLRRPHRARSTVVIDPDAPTLAELRTGRADQAPAAPARPASKSHRPRSPRPRLPRPRLPRPRWARPDPAQPPYRPWLRPTPGTGPARAPALTGVQRLLASTGAPDEEQ